MAHFGPQNALLRRVVAPITPVMTRTVALAVSLGLMLPKLLMAQEPAGPVFRARVAVVPISAVVVKTGTTSAKKPKMTKEEEAKIKGKADKKFECVFVKSGNKAKLRVIKTGIQDDTNIEVTSGLKKGDIVITGHYTTVTRELNPGDVVTVKKEEKKKADDKK